MEHKIWALCPTWQNSTSWYSVSEGCPYGFGSSTRKVGFKCLTFIHFLPLGNQVNLHTKAWFWKFLTLKQKHSLEKGQAPRPQTPKLILADRGASQFTRRSKGTPTCWSFVSSWCQASTSSSKVAPVAFNWWQQFIHQEKRAFDTPQMTCKWLLNLKSLRTVLNFNGLEKACSLPRLPFAGVCPPLYEQPQDLQSFFTAGAPKGRLCATPRGRRSCQVGAGPQGSWGQSKTISQGYPNPGSQKDPKFDVLGFATKANLWQLWWMGQSLIMCWIMISMFSKESNMIIPIETVLFMTFYDILWHFIYFMTFYDNLATEPRT